MKKKIAILGSTGSIGKILFKFVSKNLNKYEVVLLVANKNYSELLKQAKFLKVKNIILTDEKSFELLSKKKFNNIKVHKNFKSLNKIFKSKIDYTLCSITGLKGLESTLKIIKYTKTIAIANKESILCGWNLIKKNLNKFDTKFIPVDSEHFTIWYSLNNKIKANVKKIYLTASGGPFLNKSIKKNSNISINSALKHPNWKMGNKISIDSATMMNKVFEVIEAKNIFDLSYKDISILIHPKSYIHSITFFDNGLIDIIAHETSMKIPLINSLNYGSNFKLKTNPLNLKLLNNLQLSQINKSQFPVIKILDNISNNTSLFETIIVTVNDTLVNMFLNKKIKFIEIEKSLLKIINLAEFRKYKKKSPKNINEIIKLSRYVHLKTENLMYKMP